MFRSGPGDISIHFLANRPEPERARLRLPGERRERGAQERRRDVLRILDEHHPVNWLYELVNLEPEFAKLTAEAMKHAESATGIYRRAARLSVAVGAFRDKNEDDARAAFKSAVAEARPTRRARAR
jgi:hypothetical protein